ncbi:MAG: hypothetical protein HQK54_11060, partial [Oligoflexales bacterium]|nr:hypothetical protein [Oligoflexales bacterium]
MNQLNFDNAGTTDTVMRKNLTSIIAVSAIFFLFAGFPVRYPGIIPEVETLLVPKSESLSIERIIDLKDGLWSPKLIDGKLYRFFEAKCTRKYSGGPRENSNYPDASFDCRRISIRNPLSGNYSNIPEYEYWFRMKFKNEDDTSSEYVFYPGNQHIEKIEVFFPSSKTGVSANENSYAASEPHPELSSFSKRGYLFRVEAKS